MHAIALYEFASVPAGIMVGDRLVKASPVAEIYGGSVHGGKFLLLITGADAEIDEAQAAVEQVGFGCQSLLLHNVSTVVFEAILGRTQKHLQGAIAILQVSCLSILVKSLDSAVKDTGVHLDCLRLGDGLGGQGVAIVSGELWQVEEAAEVCRRTVEAQGQMLDMQVIPQLHDDMRRCLMGSDEFTQQLKIMAAKSLNAGLEQQQKPTIY